MRHFQKKFSQRITVGVGLGQRYITAVLVSRGKTPKLIETKIVNSKVDYYENQGLNTLNSQLQSVAESVSRWIGTRYVNVRVAIDDPALYASTIRYDMRTTVEAF